jgi:hypothetical protein
MAADWVGTHGRAPLQEFDVQHRQFKLVSELNFCINAVFRLRSTLAIQ